MFSRSGDHNDTQHVTFISGDIVAFVRDLKHSEGGDIWLIGGGEINTLMLEHGLIDRMILTRIPVTLGEGIPLFPEVDWENNLYMVRDQTYRNGVHQLTYKPKNSVS